MNNLRLDNQLAECIEEWGWKYHHIGIPTDIEMPNETYIPHLKFYVSGFQTSPFGIEWMRFDKDTLIHPLVQKYPHVAFEVESLDFEIKNRKFNIITESNSPSDGVWVVMIEHNGAPIELIEFIK